MFGEKVDLFFNFADPFHHITSHEANVEILVGMLSEKNDETS